MKNILRIFSPFVGATALTVGMQAAPTVYRLTPPSSLFSFNDPLPPIIARFLPDQHFDLQCTVAPDASQTITAVQFYVDNSLVAGTVSSTPATATTLSNTINSALVNIPTPVNTQVFTLRHYAHKRAGVHTLKVVATQSDGSKVTAEGNFAIEDLDRGGRRAKNVIIMIGDGMGAQHRTAARIMRKACSSEKPPKDWPWINFPSRAWSRHLRSIPL